MSPSTDDDRTLVAYLLGTLPSEEQAGLEERYLCDQALFDRLRALEAELIDDYWRGALPPDTRLRFESHYLATAPRRQRAALGQALAQHLAKGGPARDGAVATRSPVRRVAWAPAAAAVLLASALGGWWYFRPPAPVVPGPRPPSVAPPFESLTPAPGAGPASPGTPAWRHLSPGRVRTLGGTAELRRDDAALALELGQARAASPYRLALQTAEGRTVWRGGEIRAAPTGQGWALFVQLPPELLEPGDYVLVVEGPRSEDAAEYFFRVVER